MKILTSAQMGEVDRLSSERFGIPSLLLMECAGKAVCDALLEAHGSLAGRRIVIVCGCGNNGGDGLVAARHLLSRGLSAEVILAGDPKRLRGDALANWKIHEQLGLPTTVLPAAADRRSFLRNAPQPDVLVDALFGTGLSRPLEGDYARLVEWINGISAKAKIVSVDLPSGLSADTGSLIGATVHAGLTVTFTALKPALVFPPAAECAGKVVVAAIGSPSELVQNRDYWLELTDRETVRRVVPARARQSHKGHYGHLFVVAGSHGKSGAALMAGMGALRAGAGLVTLGLPAGLKRHVVGRFPELMTEFLPETGGGAIAEGALGAIMARLAGMDAVVAGPGLSQSESTRKMVRLLVRRSPVPIVLDADGLNAFAGEPHRLENEHSQPIVITPHPGEMARLSGRTVAEIQETRIETARQFSRAHGCYTVLKGCQTIIVSPTGRTLVNGTGNPGMATAGTGDVLAGMVGRFVAGWARRRSERAASQGSASLTDHLAASVYLHGLAGDLAASEAGEESLVATDLLRCLPGAFRGVSGR